MKKLLLLITLSFICINVSALELNISSDNVVMYNMKDSKILYEKNSNEKVQIASLTKIMTAIVTLDTIKDLNNRITLTSADFENIIKENLVSAGFRKGQTVTYLDLLYGLLLPSGADAANALTRVVDDDFIDLMNDKAKELGMNDTHFSNSIGLDSKNNYSTVNDVYKMFSYALKNEQFRKIITTSKYTISDGSFTVRSTVKNNKLVGSYLLGGKTGTTDGAGLCLASLAFFDDSEFILITTGAPYDKKGRHNLEDAKVIYEYFKDNYDYQTIVSKGDIILSLDTKYLKKDKIDFYVSNDIVTYLPNNVDKRKITYKYDGIKVVDSSMKKGDKLGKVKIYYDGNKIDSVDIIMKETPKFSIFKFIGVHKVSFILGILTLFIILLFVIKRKRK